MIDHTNPDYTNTPVSHSRPQFGYAPADPTVHPHVTIVTPFHNDGATFHETARSVLQQSFQQWEWLIVNDGSTEPESLAVLDCYRTADPRIRIIDHAHNKGPGAARNTGVQAARTEFIAQLDSDDLLEPTAVEKWRWFLECYPEYSFVKGYTVGFGALEYLATNGFHTGELFLDQNRVNSTSMIRRPVIRTVGGQDETNRAGLEDWDFWLHCASLGFWGGTVPEYLDWYRRSASHCRRWPNWDNGKQQRAFHKGLRQKYPGLWKEGFPRIDLTRNILNVAVPDDPPCDNLLRKTKPNLLMIVPWLNVGGADKFNLDLLQRLIGEGWTVTVVTTLKSDHPWYAEFARLTPDVFCMEHFLRLLDYPRFLSYLINSRQSDVVMVSHSWLGYLLLPYLRAHCPEATFIDYCHIEENQPGDGGYPQLAVDYKELLDLNIVSSQHLCEWMIQRGGEDKRIGVCYTNVDVEKWQTTTELRNAARLDLKLNDKMPL
ncbi:MAG: glycosyltransferase, partial [Chloroflexi bacterium]|nr:glycosyltransferase [Chloroflexota bacterium]